MKDRVTVRQLRGNLLWVILAFVLPALLVAPSWVLAKEDINSKASAFTVVGGTYDGSEQVTCKADSLKEGTDYSVKFEDAVNAGTHVAVITGMGYYEGTLLKHYTIAPADVTKATISGLDDVHYTGQEVKPTLTLTYGQLKLREGVDYTLKFSKNKKVGMAEVTVTGRGNYVNSFDRSFQIRYRHQLVYRLYNKWSGEHLFTTEAKEYEDCGRQGWTQEGVAWDAPDPSDTPVYRLYNKFNGEHLYTTSRREHDILVAKKWTSEGVKLYSAGSMPIYRLFNPYAQVGTHIFTIERSEYDSLAGVGWRQEGAKLQGLYGWE